MNYTTLLGLVAGTLTTIAFLPQVIKTYKTKSTKDISLGMFAISCTGVFLWEIYGIITRDFPIIISSSVTIVLISIILFYKIKYK